MSNSNDLAKALIGNKNWLWSGTFPPTEVRKRAENYGPFWENLRESTDCVK